MKNKGRIFWIIGIVIGAIFNTLLLAILLVSNGGSVQETIAMEEGIAVVLNGDTTVFIPSTIDIEPSAITMTKVDNNFDYTDVSLNAYDISIENMNSFDTLIKIQLPYDDSQMESGENIESCLFAGYYDENSDSIQPVVYSLNSKDKFITIETNHLTTFVAGVAKDRAIFDEQVNSALQVQTGSDILFDKSRLIFDGITTKIKNSASIDVVDSTKLSMTYLSNGNSILGGFMGLMDDGLLYTDWFENLKIVKSRDSNFASSCDELALYGDVLVGTQFMLDIANGSVETANENLMKNMASSLVGKCTSIGGIATFAIDYSLNELGSVLEEDVKIIEEGYVKYYKAYEDEQDQSFIMRMYPKIYEIYKENSVLGHFDTITIEKEVSDLIKDYCNLIWDEDYVEYFGNAGNRNFNNEELQQKLTYRAYDDIMQVEMVAIIARIQKQFIYEAKMEALEKKYAIEKDYGRAYLVEVREVNNMNSDVFQYANAFLQFDVFSEMKDIWTIQLDDQGKGTLQFTKFDYLTSMAPKSAFIYKTKEDMEAGVVMEEVPFEFLESNGTITVLLGAEAEFLMTSSIDANQEPLSIGETVWFNIEPSDETLYSYEWSISEVITPYLEHAFSEPGQYNVQCMVYDKSGNPVAVLSKQLSVLGMDPISLISDKTSIETNEIINFEIRQYNDYYMPTYGIQWDFGDGYIELGDYNAFEYMYDTPGEYTVVVTEYINNEDGTQQVLNTAKTTVTVLGATDSTIEVIDTTSQNSNEGIQIYYDVEVYTTSRKYILYLDESIYAKYGDDYLYSWSADGDWGTQVDKKAYYTYNNDYGNGERTVSLFITHKDDRYEILDSGTIKIDIIID